LSTHKVEVIRLGKLEEHPNAERLWITQVFSYPVITVKDGFKEGELVAYVPIDSVVPDTPEWRWLAPKDFEGEDLPEKYRHIKAKKLRGVFSMGLLHKAPPGANVGDNVADELSITKYVPPETLVSGGEDEADHAFIPHYTEIENYLRYSSKLTKGEDVVISEKLHGANSRFAFMSDTGRLHVGSHGKMKKEDAKNQWWAAAKKFDLETKLAKYPDKVFYGELLGTQDLKYGLPNGQQTLRFFDILDAKTRTYLDYEDALFIFKELDLPTVPPLFLGPLPDLEGLRKFTEAESVEFNKTVNQLKMVKQPKHVCEGIVIKPISERFDMEIGRVILKLISEQYLMRKGGSEGK
jgi:RNA ligase (TIGR02306 family)